MSSDDYIRVRGRVLDVREKSFLFAVGDSVPRGSWVPRSCIHAADDLSLDAKTPREETTIRMREWKADECGFTGTHVAGGAADDLFAEH